MNFNFCVRCKFAVFMFPLKIVGVFMNLLSRYRSCRQKNCMGLFYCTQQFVACTLLRTTYNWLQDVSSQNKIFEIYINNNPIFNNLVQVKKDIEVPRYTEVSNIKTAKRNGIKQRSNYQPLKKDNPSLANKIRNKLENR